MARTQKLKIVKNGGDFQDMRENLEALASFDQAQYGVLPN